MDGKDTGDEEVKELKATVTDGSPMRIWISCDDGRTWSEKDNRKPGTKSQ